MRTTPAPPSPPARPARSAQCPTSLAARWLLPAWWGWVLALTPLVAASPAGPLTPEVGGLIGRPMYQDPATDRPSAATRFEPRLIDLWLDALRSDEADDRRLAAEAFARAHEDGLSDFDAALPVLSQMVRNDPVALVRASAAATLDVIDDRAAADALAAVIDESDIDVVLPADRALARWGHRDAAPAWRNRLANPDAPLALRLSAAEAVGRVGDEQATEPLAELVLDAQAGLPLRMAAAKALGGIARSGLLDVARRLDAQPTAVTRLLQVRVLAGHQQPAARQAIERLAIEGEPAASAAALEALNTQDHQLVRALAPRVTRDGRPHVRYQLAVASAAAPGDQAPARLGPALDDTSLRVRAYARDRLIEMGADAPRREAVAAVVLGVLADPPGWRSAEQAALVAGHIELESAGEALVALMDHPRPEARLAVLDALRRIEVAQTLPAMLERARALTDQWPSPDDPDDPDAGVTPESVAALDSELPQLFQAFGAMRYAPADSLLRRYVPKSQAFGSESRAAAVFALGKIFEGEGDPSLARDLQGRLADATGLEPEVTPVRRMAAITLGRLDAEAHLATLRRFAEEEANGEIGAACRWAIGQITGTTPAGPEPRVGTASGYFLEPLAEDGR